MTDLLSDFFPELILGQYDDSLAFKYSDEPVLWDNWRDAKVISQTKWPGRHKYVSSWCVLDNGIAVGWNESPSGWSFPVRKFDVTNDLW